MPRATVDRTQVHHYDLKSCPPDGYVKLRKMSYIEVVTRRDLSAKMSYEQRQNRNRQTQNDETVKAMLEAMQKVTVEYEFKVCIVEHNLENADGHLLDFGNPNSYIDLDPQVGAEIGKYIDELNPVGDEENLNGSKTVPTSSLLEEPIPQIESSDDN